MLYHDLSLTPQLNPLFSHAPPQQPLRGLCEGDIYLATTFVGICDTLLHNKLCSGAVPEGLLW